MTDHELDERYANRRDFEVFRAEVRSFINTARETLAAVKAWADRSSAQAVTIQTLQQEYRELETELRGLRERQTNLEGRVAKITAGAAVALVIIDLALRFFQ